MKINQMRTFKKNHNSNYTRKIHTAEIRKIMLEKWKIVLCSQLNVYGLNISWRGLAHIIPTPHVIFMWQC